MKRMIGWLGSRFNRRSGSAGDDQADDPVIVEADDDELHIELPSDTEVAAWMAERESAQVEITATLPQIEILESDLPDGGESTGYDPYNKD